VGDLQESIEEQAKNSGWLNAYHDLKAHGLHWKKAAFCAWYNAPKPSRQPKNQNQLAELLNYKSPQVFYKWQKAGWFRELGIDRLRESILLQHLADIDRRTITDALSADGSAGVAARRLYYEQVDKARPDVAEEDGVLIWLKVLRESGQSDEMANNDSEIE
jgi:hypothetical protein